MAIRKKKNYLSYTDRRLDLGPAGRNLFVSHEKQMQDRAARRVKVYMRIVMALGILTVLVAAGFFVFAYLVPYFHSEFSISGESSTSSAGSMVEISTPVYDDLGLPVYDDSLNLYVVSHESPAGAEDVPEITEENGIRFDSRITPALHALQEAAKAEGLALVFTKGYVSYKEQEELYNQEVERLEREEGLSVVMARRQAAETVPEPGECDDQSGLCLTLQGDAETFPDSQTYQWLNVNMGKYGFVFRYPEYKESYTNHIADLTVIRYVGAESAEAMRRLSMSLEEYISYLKSQ